MMREELWFCKWGEALVMGQFEIGVFAGLLPISCPMIIAGCEFEHVCNIEPVRDKDGTVRVFMTQDRYQNARSLPLNRYGAGPFCKFKVPNRFQASGVYALTVGDEVRYVGECTNLSARFNAGYGNISPKNCFKGGQETNCRLNNLVYTAVQAGGRISLWFFKTADYKSMEAALRSTLTAAWNRV
jgi:hypothetical protein